MKRLMTMSFIILFSVLSILSYINFSYNALEEIEKDKQAIIIEKDSSISNEQFLSDIDRALDTIGQDIMYRYVDVSNKKPEYSYYKTNHTIDFIKSRTAKDNFLIDEKETISTHTQRGHKTFDLYAASVFQDISFYNWKNADVYDLSLCTYYVKREAAQQVAQVINELGYKVTMNTEVFISAKMSVFLFSFIPAFLLFISMLFYVLSNGKRNVIKKMEGYKVRDILTDEIKYCSKSFLGAFLAVELISVPISEILFRKARMEFYGYKARYIVIGLAVCLLSIMVSSLVIYTQNRAEYIKGRVPRKGIYYLSMLAKCIFIAFITFFMSIAIRNVKICYNTYVTSHFIAEKVKGYVTLPINENNASSSGLDENYRLFYQETVDKYNGILIDSGNYEYNLTSDSTLCEEFGQDNIVVNKNYLTFNPIYDLNGKQIDSSMFDKNKFNVLLPNSKKDAAEKYKVFVEKAYSLETNFILYDDVLSKIYTYNARTGTGAYGEIKSPVILAVQDSQLEGIFIRSYCSKGGYFLDTEKENPYSELLPILKQTGIDKVTLQTPYIRSNFDKLLEQQFQMLILYGSQTLILSIGLFCLILFSGKLYYENERGKLACSICEGYTLLNCMRKHFILTIFVYGIGMAGICVVGKIVNVAVNLFLPMAAMILDIACTFLLCKKYMIKHLHEIMKGAD